MTDDDRKKFLLDLKKFISFRTETGAYTKEFDRCFAWIKAFFKGLKVEFVSVESGGFKSLIIKPKNSKKPKVLGLGHIDVVPAEEEQYEMTEKDGWIYGRGVADMKLQNLVMIYSFLELEKSKLEHDYWLALTSDEEVGGFNGARAVADYLADNEQVPDIVFAPDGGHGFQFQETEKGVAHFKIVSKGSSAHGSRPWLGDNALTKIVKFAEHMESVFPIPENEQDWRPTLSLNKITGGTATNKVPDYAEALFDGRLTEIFTIGGFEDFVLTEAKRFGLEGQLIAAGDVMHSPSSNPIAKEFISLIESVVDRKVSAVKSSGASDARFFSKLNSVILMTNPTVRGMHERSESCLLDSVWKLIEITNKLTIKYATELGSTVVKSTIPVTAPLESEHKLMLSKKKA